MDFLDWLRRDDPGLAADVAFVLELRSADQEQLAAELQNIKDVERRLSGAIAVWEAESHLAGL